MDKDEQIREYREKVDKKLIIRQRIFSVVVFVLIVIGVVNVVSGKLDIILAVTGFLLAVIIGVGLSRMFKIFWHPKEEKVMSRLDTMGVILLLIYITIEIGKNWFFGHWLAGASLTAFSLIVLTGLLLGRFIGTMLKINKILAEDKK